MPVLSQAMDSLQNNTNINLGLEDVIGLDQLDIRRLNESLIEQEMPGDDEKLEEEEPEELERNNTSKEVDTDKTDEAPGDLVVPNVAGESTRYRIFIYLMTIEDN